MYPDADAVLAGCSKGREDARLNPMVNYLRGYFKQLAGDTAAAAQFYARAGKGLVAYTNPLRLEGKAALEAAIRANPRDAHAHLFLGNLLYASNQREEGFANWKKAVELDKELVLAWRNVGYGERYLKKDLHGSYAAYEQAIRLDPNDARVLLELDQVAEALNIPSSERLSRLLDHEGTVSRRDDLMARLIDLRLDQGGAGNLQAAYSVLKNRHFHSWEGRYGIHHAWIEVNKKLGDAAFDKKEFDAALTYYKQAGDYPDNLEVAPRTPDFHGYQYWDLARTYKAMGKQNLANEYLKKILAEQFSKPNLGTYYKALAAKSAGKEDEYRSLLRELQTEARKRTSGNFEYKGPAKAVGYYLLSLALEQEGNKAAAEEERRKALQMNPLAARLAMYEAQIDIARAHQ